MTAQEYELKMNQLQAQCSEYKFAAKIAYEKNGGKVSKEQCIYLQKACQCEADMANLSKGIEHEYLYHRSRMNELEEKIAQILKILKPEENMIAITGNEISKTGKRAAAEKKKTEKPKKTEKEMEALKKWLKEEDEIPKHRMSDIAGMDSVKEQLQKCLAAPAYKALRAYFEMPVLNSFFFIGPPGCGKTYLIEAFVHELVEKGYHYISITGADVMSKYVGDTEKIIEEVFDAAEANAPCVLFIDEIDGYCKNRSIPNLPEYASQLTTSFLIGYNRINASNKPIFFIGATNYPNQVDNAMLDRVELINIPLPDKKAREEAFRRKLERIIPASEVSYEELAELTEIGNYNYRDIERLVKRIKENMIQELTNLYPDAGSCIEAVKSGRYILRREVIEQAMRVCQPSPKDDILREIDEWTKKFQFGMENGEG